MTPAAFNQARPAIASPSEHGDEAATASEAHDASDSTGSSMSISSGTTPSGRDSGSEIEDDDAAAQQLPDKSYL